MRAKSCWTKPASNPIHRRLVLTESVDSGSRSATLARQLFSTALSELAGGDFGGKAFRITSSPLFKTSGSSLEGKEITSLPLAASSSLALCQTHSAASLSLSLLASCSPPNLRDLLPRHRPFEQQPVQGLTPLASPRPGALCVSRYGLRLTSRDVSLITLKLWASEQRRALRFLGSCMWSSSRR